jgi:transposase
MLDRLELLLIQITELEQSRDAALEDKPRRSYKHDPAACQVTWRRCAERHRAGARGVRARIRQRQGARVLCRVTATPYSSGGTEREQGIGKAGNVRLRTLMVELAWLWQRYQPDSAQVSWFRERVSGTGRRMRKVMVVALARKLLIALWRFATQGVVPEGAVMKPAP